MNDIYYSRERRSDPIGSSQLSCSTTDLQQCTKNENHTFTWTSEMCSRLISASDSDFSFRFCREIVLVRKFAVFGRKLQIHMQAVSLVNTARTWIGSSRKSNIANSSTSSVLCNGENCQFRCRQCSTHCWKLPIQVQAVSSVNTARIQIGTSRKYNTGNLDTCSFQNKQFFALIHIFSLFRLDVTIFTLPGNSLLIWEEYCSLSFFKIPVDTEKYSIKATTF